MNDVRGHRQTQTNGECVYAKSQRSQSSPSSVIEDSGTESGEDLRLLNPELLAEVRGALTKLKCALPTLDTARRASIIPLVNKLQSCLRLGTNHLSSSHSTLSNNITNKRIANRAQQQRKCRHTVGVSKEELADARRWLAENCLEKEPVPKSGPPKQTCGGGEPLPLIHESTSKTYKPVKFTPIPPREDRDKFNPCRYPVRRYCYEKPQVEKVTIVDIPKPLLALKTCTDNHYRERAPPVAATEFQKQLSEEQLKRENCSSDEGDVSSTEEESLRAELYGRGKSPTESAIKKVPSRFQKNNNKARTKRANTIDIPKLINCESFVTSSGDESVYRSADELCKPTQAKIDSSRQVHHSLRFEMKTDKDKKFAEFLEKTKQDDLQSKAVTYNPNAAVGDQWSNRFSRIKTTFEQGRRSKPPSSSEEYFKSTCRVATFPKQSKNCFSYTPQSYFRPMNSTTPSLYDRFKPYSGPFDPHALQSNNLENCYTPLVSVCATNGYHSDINSKTVYCYPHPVYPKQHIASYTSVPEYFLAEQNTYVHPTEYRVADPVPTYHQQQYTPYLSLPTSPLSALCQYRKPAEFCEEGPAHSRIMGKPQQAMVVKNKPNYSNDTASTKPYVASTYRKLAEKFSELQNCAPCVVPRKPEPSSKSSVVLQKQHTMPRPKQQVVLTPPSACKIQIKSVENEADQPEQFFVLRRRNKFERLNANSGGLQPLPPQINEKAFFKPVSNVKRRASPPALVQQSRSPPQSPVQMPSVLQKSESWHQIIMERMKQAKPPSPIKPKMAKAKSSHNLATKPKQYEASFSPDTIKLKQHTVEQFLLKDKQRTSSESPVKSATTLPMIAAVPKVNEDFECVDEAFEILFKESSNKTV